MASTSEKTPLVSGAGAGGDSTFYFTKSAQARVAAGDNVSISSASQDGSSSAVDSNIVPARRGKGWWPFGGTKIPTAVKAPIRKVPVKVEPKVFFSNERTFIAWMHMSVTLSTIAIAILAFADHNEWSQVYGLILMPVAICFIIYSLLQYMRRAKMIRNRLPGPYDDQIGPPLLATMLMVAIILNFAIKVYDLYYY